VALEPFILPQNMLECSFFSAEATEVQCDNHM